MTREQQARADLARAEWLAAKAKGVAVDTLPARIDRDVDRAWEDTAWRESLLHDGESRRAARRARRELVRRALEGQAPSPPPAWLVRELKAKAKGAELKSTPPPVSAEPEPAPVLEPEPAPVDLVEALDDPGPGSPATFAVVREARITWRPRPGVLYAVEDPGGPEDLEGPEAEDGPLTWEEQLSREKSA